MKIGMCMHQESYVTNHEVLPFLSSSGISGVEIWQHAFDVHGIEKVLEIYKNNNNIEVSSVNPYFDFTTTEGTYKSSIELGKRMLEYAAALNCRILRVYSSAYGSIESSDTATEEQWDRGIRGVTELCDLSKPYGVSCVLEANETAGQLFDNTPSLMRMIRSVNRTNLTINFQPTLRGEHYLESAHALAPFIGHLHVHNFIGGWPNIVPMDTPDGEVDIEKYVRLLYTHGFDGYLTIEHVQATDFDRITRDTAFLKKVIVNIESR